MFRVVSSRLLGRRVGLAFAGWGIAACAAGENYVSEPPAGGSGGIAVTTGGSANGGSAGGGVATGGSASGGAVNGGAGSTDFGITPGGKGQTGGATGEGCATIRTEAESAPGDIYIMQDRSGSMLDNGKWTAVLDAITEFVNTPDLQGLGVGLAFFGREPSAAGPCGSCTTLDCLQRCGCTSSSCINNVCTCTASRSSCDSADYASPTVEISPLPGVASAIVKAYGAITPSGSTPSYPALDGAIRHAKAWVDAHHRRTVVVFATDGEPTECDRATNTVAGCSALAAAGAGQGIPTFVIGVGDSLTSLDAVAAAGGTNKAFIVDAGGGAATKQQFIEALKQIRTSTSLACTYALPPPPPDQLLDPKRVNVDYTKGSPPATVTLPSVASKSDCGSGPGWYYDNPAKPTQIVMCDATCTELSSSAPNRRIDIVLGCATIVRPIM